MQCKHIDIHSHLNDPAFDADMDDVLSRMRSSGTKTIVIGTDKKMSERAILLAEKHSDIWATIGIHPTDNHKEHWDPATYRTMAEHPRVVAIGECGIDYFRLGSFAGNKDAEADRQQELFEEQMELAVAVDKPLMIHGRPMKGGMDAYEDILHILRGGQKKNGERVRGNVHFFVGNTDIAKQFLDLGFTMSFTAVLTFARDYDEVVRYIPLTSIMAETDAPYVAPASRRGSRNEPSYVEEVAEKIAEIRGEDREKVASALVENALRTFLLR